MLEWETTAVEDPFWHIPPPLCMCVCVYRERETTDRRERARRLYVCERWGGWVQSERDRERLTPALLEFMPVGDGQKRLIQVHPSTHSSTIPLCVLRERERDQMEERA